MASVPAEPGHGTILEAQFLALRSWRIPRLMMCVAGGEWRSEVGGDVRLGGGRSSHREKQEGPRQAALLRAADKQPGWKEETRPQTCGL